MSAQTALTGSRRNSHSRVSATPRNHSTSNRRAKCTNHARAGDLVIRGFLEQLGTPRALAVWLMYRYDAHDQLVSLQIDPTSYEDAERFRKDYAATKLLSKCADLRTGIDTRAVALKAAEDAEIQCTRTNEKIAAMRSDPTFASFPESDRSVMSELRSAWCRAAVTIQKILGPLPGLDDLEEAGWSPGRTTSCYGSEISSMHKYAGRLDVTPSAFGIARCYVGASPSWGQAALDADGPCSPLMAAYTFVRGNTLTVVPKNAKTDRSICYEPHLNVRTQLTVGGYIRKRLRLHGINLNDQSINQRRAALASRLGHLATLDLKSASDTVSVELVRELLPPDWFSLLDKLRSKETFWPDQTWRRNAKFSSMGNGFTFELESLLFYALASSVTGGVSVYGDDLIVPSDAYEAVVSVLQGSGFAVNEQKSFAHGWFRESCGLDCFRGLDCTPVYIRSLQKGADWFRITHNRMRAWFAVLPRIEHANFLRWIRNQHTSFLGPSGFGDGHYHVNLDEATPSRARWGLEGWWFKSVTRIARVNSLYGDRVSGRYSGRFAAAALCTALGPRPSRYVVDVTVDRRLYVLKSTRVLSPVWEDIVWV